MAGDYKTTNFSEVDVDKIMEKIRTEVALRRGRTVDSVITGAQNQNIESETIDTSMIRSVISSVEMNADIARTPSMLKFQGLTRKLAVFAAGKITYLSSFITNKQRNFNITAIHALKTLADNLEKLNERTGALGSEDAKAMNAVQEIRNQLSMTESAVESINTERAEVKSAIEGIRAQITATVESINAEHAEVKSTIAGIKEQITKTGAVLESRRVEHLESKTALINAMNEKTSKIAELENALSCLKYTMTMQERQLSMFLEEAGKHLPEHFSVEEINSLAGIKEHMLDALYVSFEDRFRGTREDIKERAKVYLPYIKGVNAGTEDSQVLDIGCGRGEWLELLKEEELHASGVDANKIFINQCRARGFNVIEGDAVSYLRTLSDGSLGAVTGLHIVEHLPFETLIKLLDETTRVLKAGGIAIFETPNPENILVGSCNFYLDPTHRKPLPSVMMKFMAEARGLSRVEILNLHPVTEAKRLPGSDVAERFSEYFYGPQDYAVIAYKK